jgi:integrase/recombinase XerD
MSKKTNDIKHLEHLARVRGMLAGAGGPKAVGAVVAAPLAPKPATAAIRIEREPSPPPSAAAEAVFVERDEAESGESPAFVPLHERLNGEAALLTAPTMPPKALSRLIELPVAPTTLVRLGSSSRPEQIYGAYLAARACEKSRSAMRASLERAAAMLGPGIEARTIPWHQLRFEHTSAIRARLLEGRYSRSSVLHTLTALRGIIQHAWRMGFMTMEEAARATDWPKLTMPERTPSGRELSQEELDKLAVYCDSQEDAYGAFLNVVFALLLGTGLRAFELCGLPCDAYDAAKRRLRVYRKGGKIVNVPLGAAEARALEQWIEARRGMRRLRSVPALIVRVHDNDWVRSREAMEPHALAYLCLVVAKAAGIARFAPHDLRRTFATRALRISGDLATVQWFMSHSDPQTTKRYDMRQIEEFETARRTWKIWR